MSRLVLSAVLIGTALTLCGAPRMVAADRSLASAINKTAGSPAHPAQLKPAVSSTPPSASAPQNQTAIAALRSMNLQIPIDGFNPEKIKGSFYEMRGGQMHKASDFLSPRFTPIHAVSDGQIAKLFLSKAGGNTIYEFDPSKRFDFYYAHLQSYAPGLKDGAKVKKGQVIGFVGTSGNAPPGTPHLHFSIEVLGPDKRWWQGTPVDPYEVFRRP